jgi:tungstate transport system ATP-binding protein
MTASSPVLELREVSVERGGRLVLRVEVLEVAPGDVVAVVGPNGAGKSTLLLASALLLPSAGEVRLLGERPGRRNVVALRRQTATVFQDAALLDMTARANVETALRLHAVPRAEREDRASRWLERLGVAHRADARAHQLSGGEAQRVSLARAFAVQPRLLFLDEPFSSLDRATRSELLGDVRALLAAEGTTALLTTHDRAEAELLADRMVVLLDGAIAQQGPTAELIERPTSPEVARFFGWSVVPAAVAVRLAGVELRGGGEAAIPPVAVRLTSGGVEAEVVALRGAPAGAEVVVDAGAPVALWMTVAELRARGIEVGSHVTVSAQPDRIVWFAA